MEYLETCAWHRQVGLRGVYRTTLSQTSRKGMANSCIMGADYTEKCNTHIEAFFLSYYVRIVGQFPVFCVLEPNYTAWDISCQENDIPPICNPINISNIGRQFQYSQQSMYYCIHTVPKNMKFGLKTKLQIDDKKIFMIKERKKIV